MCTKQPFPECFAEDLLEDIENLLQRPMFVVYLGLCVIISMLLYLIRIVSQRPTMSQSSAATSTLPEHTAAESKITTESNKNNLTIEPSIKTLRRESFFTETTEAQPMASTESNKVNVMNKSSSKQLPRETSLYGSERIRSMNEILKGEPTMRNCYKPMPTPRVSLEKESNIPTRISSFNKRSTNNSLHSFINNQGACSSSQRSPRLQRNHAKPSSCSDGIQSIRYEISTCFAKRYIIITAVCLIAVLTFLLPNLSQRINENERLKEMKKVVSDISEHVSRVEEECLCDAEELCLLSSLITSSFNDDDQEERTISSVIYTDSFEVNK